MDQANAAATGLQSPSEMLSPAPSQAPAWRRVLDLADLVEIFDPDVQVFVWQGNERFGAIHRSPEIAPDAGARTLVTLDPLWQP